MAIKAIVLDVEGTTTDINFVHKTLFPYAYEKLSEFIESHQNDFDMPDVLKTLTHEVLQQSKQNSCDLSDIVAILRQWIRDDLKQPELKKIQGYIWNEAYKSGEIKGHLYPDVIHAFKMWKEQGKTIAIYSSGSVLAQKNLFQYSVEGDLTSFISGYFDTAIGMKRESLSYKNIAKEMNISENEILFLSDIWQELAAAKEAGFQVAQVVRPGTEAYSGFRHVKELIEI